MGRRARALVERELDPSRVAGLRASAYRQALEARTRSRRPAVNDWVRDAVRPRDEAGSSLEFLDHVAFRALATYASGRLLGRVRRRFGDLFTKRRRRGGGVRR